MEYTSISLKVDESGVIEAFLFDVFSLNLSENICLQSNFSF